MVSPIGSLVSDHIQQQKAESPEFARLWEENRPARERAWKIIKYRMDHGLTQFEFALIANTSKAFIELLEEGEYYPTEGLVLRVLKVIEE